MKQKISRKFLLLSISFALLLGTGIVLACADSSEFEDFFNSFFSPETSHADTYQAFYRTSHDFYGRGEQIGNEDAIRTDSVNLEEWVKFFNQKVNENDLQYLVYKARIGEIDTSIFYLKNHAFPISKFLRVNSLFSYEDKITAKEFLFYLGFAKRCEPYATYTPYWWESDDDKNPNKDTTSLRKLSDNGKKAMENVHSSILKERYGFQLTRLFFYEGSYRECLDFYKKYSDLFLKGQSIYYRELGYLAASYYKLKEYSEANYLYSVIFDQFSIQQKSCFLSFHPQEESDWEGSLALAKTDHEKEVLWELLGIYEDPLRAMKAIYSLDKQSSCLNLLLVRAVNINEESFITYPEFWSRHDSGYALNALKLDTSLFHFIQIVAEEGKSEEPYLWNLATGYFHLVQKDYNTAEKYLNKAGILASANDSLVIEQIHALRIISHIEQYQKPNPKMEDILSKDLNWLSSSNRHPDLRNNSIYHWALSRLSEKYGIWGDSLKAICLDVNQKPQFYNNPKNIHDLISLMDKPVKTNFEKLLITNFPYKRRDLFEYRAILLTYQYRFGEAISMLNSCKDAGDTRLFGNPFEIHINDCHVCDFQVKQEISYTVRSFLEQLIALQKKTKADPKNAANYLFQIANALYNMTYFGNARLVYESPFIAMSSVIFDFAFDPSYKELVDCSLAQEYYLKAWKASTDKEFNAKCCFMASKCEQNQFYVSIYLNREKQEQSFVYFKNLRDEFSKTRYYKDILAECGYFSKYVKRK